MKMDTILRRAKSVLATLLLVTASGAWLATNVQAQCNVPVLEDDFVILELLNVTETATSATYSWQSTYDPIPPVQTGGPGAGQTLFIFKALFEVPPGVTMDDISDISYILAEDDGTVLSSEGSVEIDVIPGTTIPAIEFQYLSGEQLLDGRIATISYTINQAAVDPVRAFVVNNGFGVSRHLLDNVFTLEGCTGALPVELTSFDAVVNGKDALLRWSTASETNNAGFEIQHAVGGGDFAAVEFVAGKGTTLEAQSYSYNVANLAAGRHTFRLKQVDYDGTVAYSPIVEVSVDLPGAYELSGAYPNPFNPQTQFTLTLATQQQVVVEVFDVLGHRVATLHEGPLSANQVHTFRFEAGNLPSGVYLYRATGEHFTAVRQVMLLK